MARCTANAGLRADRSSSNERWSIVRSRLIDWGLDRLVRIEVRPGVIVPKNAVALAGHKEGNHCLCVELDEFHRDIGEIQETVLELATAVPGDSNKEFPRIEMI